METQQDSLDIGYLQRVALGQQSTNTQLPSHQLIPVEASLSGTSDHQPVRNLDNSVSLVTAEAPESRPKSPSHPSPSSLRSPSGERQHVAEALKSDKSQLFKSDNHKRAPLRRPMKMGSAETMPSDTQVISQSVYDDLIRQNQETAAHNETENSLADQATLATMYEGDNGHIDLLAGFDHINTDAVNADENEDQSSVKLGESSPMHYQPSFFPESQRFVAKTPATVVKHSQTDGLNTGSPTVSRNPLASDVGSSGGIMALSQVFRGTQAPSSPLVRGQNSDPMSDRPSPNLPIQGHLLATTLSSPLNKIATTSPRESSEPQLNYVSMKESQAERHKIQQERLTRSAEPVCSEDHSDGEFDKEPSFVERMARQRTIDREAAAQFAGLTAPARPPSRQSRTTDKASEEAEQSSAALEDRQQMRISALPTDEASEEETEHEQESHQPVPKSQELKSSTEEDKENYDDPATTPLAAATNAHDRLSQVLSLDGSLSPSPRRPIGPPADSQRQSQKEIRGEALDGINRSSQTIVVEDSQQSPKHNKNENTGNTDLEPWDQYAAQQPVSQAQPPYDTEKTTCSPQKSIRIQSSPPSASQRSRVSFRLDNNEQSRGRSDSVSSRESSDHRARHSLAPNDNTMQAGLPTDPNFIEMVEKTSRSELREKSSSMPSRVAETPVHRSRVFGDEIPATDAPETSPNRSQNDLMDQEDDDLPPIHSTAHERISHSQPLDPDSSSPVKSLLNSKILSSPSGRQRRALTEIAADVSPRVGLGTFDVDINILSADDREFRSAVAMSPIQPRKKRRGNDGRNICASDSIVPITPRPTSHIMRFKEHYQTETEDPQPTEPEVAPEAVFEKRSRPSRRMDTVWEIDDTPHYHTSRTERLRRLARSLEKKLQPPSDPGKNTDVQPAVDRDRQSTSPDPLAQPHTTPSRKATHQKPSIDIASEPIRLELPPAENVQVAVNQVFAPWSGSKRAYYPATCFGKPFGTSSTRYLVKFEDAAPIEVPMSAVKILELRVGDAVKVDMPNVPKVTHIIRGLADKLSADELSKEANYGVVPMTDIYGNSTVILGPKQRKSLPSGGLTGPESVVKVPISRIYLDTILWNQLKDRTFSYSSVPIQPDSRLQTPSERYSTPTSPSTRLSRSIRFSNGVFSGMVFAVSYGDNSNTKSRITQMILDNDGRILNDGFNELFDLPTNAPLATPFKSPSPGANENRSHLRLARGAEDVGFACLIADRHSRRPKYMQALALNLPCLSGRWVEDCVAQGRVVDWELYLLPAGESSYLNGATKSRMLAPYPASEARLPDVVSARPNLLADQSVLIVMGRGKADEERRKAYLFLTYALGASRVERVPDVKSARTVLDQDNTANKCKWDWIYVDNDEKASAIATILGAPLSGSQKAQPTQRSKKRKRMELSESISNDDPGLNTNVKIVGNEFVCQSLILGKLVD